MYRYAILLMAALFLLMICMLVWSTGLEQSETLVPTPTQLATETVSSEIKGYFILYESDEVTITSTTGATQWFKYHPPMGTVELHCLGPFCEGKYKIHTDVNDPFAPIVERSLAPGWKYFYEAEGRTGKKTIVIFYPTNYWRSPGDPGYGVIQP